MEEKETTMAVTEAVVRPQRAPVKPDVDDERYYPESDGKPMGETKRHVQQLGRLLEALDLHFAEESHVYVGGNNLIYYVPGNRRKFVVPDLFAVRGVPKGERRVYLTWMEGKCPDFILELLSHKTKRRDKTTKKRFYQDTFRTGEYFLFDPDTCDLLGYRLGSSGRYRRLTPDARGRLHSEVLGLTFGLDAWGWLRAYRPDGSVLPTLEEAAATIEAQAAEIARLTEMGAQAAAALQQTTATIEAQAAEIARLTEMGAQRDLTVGQLAATVDQLAATMEAQAAEIERMKAELDRPRG
jgi:Uma2 family endonuclease